nr:MAG TPA: hypothetical protein [Caudoviricetes sp.]
MSTSIFIIFMFISTIVVTKISILTTTNYKRIMLYVILMLSIMPQMCLSILSSFSFLPLNLFRLLLYYHPGVFCIFLLYHSQTDQSLLFSIIHLHPHKNMCILFISICIFYKTC